jgi:hypothetical protein
MLMNVGPWWDSEEKHHIGYHDGYHAIALCGVKSHDAHDETSGAGDPPGKTCRLCRLRYSFNTPDEVDYYSQKALEDALWVLRDAIAKIEGEEGEEA